jgi:hypothetical protein
VAQLAYLRTVQDWIVRPQLRTVPGVADVDSLGGYVKEYLVEPDPAKIAAFGISYDDLADALEKANVSVGANYIQRSGEAYLVRADARVHSLDEIARAVVATRGGVPITVGQVAKVEIGGELRRGAASRDGHETVVGSALMLVGANSRTVAGAVGVKLQEIAKTLPPVSALCRRWTGHNWCWPRSPQSPRIWLKVRTRRDHPLRAAGQLARGANRHAGHSALAADQRDRHERAQYFRQSDVAWRAGFRADHRWRGDHCRKQPAPSGRAAGA